MNKTGQRTLTSSALLVSIDAALRRGGILQDFRPLSQCDLSVRSTVHNGVREMSGGGAHSDESTSHRGVRGRLRSTPVSARGLNIPCQFL